MKMAESTPISPIKKKVKCSKLAGTTTTKTTFKSKCKKEFSFITSMPNGVIASRRYSCETAHVTLFCDHQMCSISAKYEVWTISKGGK